MPEGCRSRTAGLGAAGRLLLLVLLGGAAPLAGAEGGWIATEGLSGTPTLHAPIPQSPTPQSGDVVIPDPEGFEAAAPTDDPELEAEVRRIAGQLRCPTCQALSIADSPSELSREMEGVIRDRLLEGMTAEEVRQSFVEAYGEWILLSPEPSGFNLLAYILPFVFLLIGGGVIVVGVRRWVAASPEEQGAAP